MLEQLPADILELIVRQLGHGACDFDAALVLSVVCRTLRQVAHGILSHGDAVLWIHTPASLYAASAHPFAFSSIELRLECTNDEMKLALINLLRHSNRSLQHLNIPCAQSTLAMLAAVSQSQINLPNLRTLRLSHDIPLSAHHFTGSWLQSLQHLELLECSAPRVLVSGSLRCLFAWTSPIPTSHPPGVSRITQNAPDAAAADDNDNDDDDDPDFVGLDGDSDNSCDDMMSITDSDLSTLDDNNNDDDDGIHDDDEDDMDHLDDQSFPHHVVCPQLVMAVCGCSSSRRSHALLGIQPVEPEPSLLPPVSFTPPVHPQFGPMYTIHTSNLSPLSSTTVPSSNNFVYHSFSLHDCQSFFRTSPLAVDAASFVHLLSSCVVLEVDLTTASLQNIAYSLGCLAANRKTFDNVQFLGLRGIPVDFVYEALLPMCPNIKEVYVDDNTQSFLMEHQQNLQRAWMEMRSGVKDACPKLATNLCFLRGPSSALISEA